MRISDWSSDVCSSDLNPQQHVGQRREQVGQPLDADDALQVLGQQLERNLVLQIAHQVHLLLDVCLPVGQYACVQFRAQLRGDIGKVRRLHQGMRFDQADRKSVV